MTGQMGGTARRLLAAFFALALLITALPGTSWTAPTDPNLAAGDYALVQVAHGTAGAVAAKATGIAIATIRVDKRFIFFFSSCYPGSILGIENLRDWQKIYLLFARCFSSSKLT